MRELTWKEGSISVVDYVVRSPDPNLTALDRYVYIHLISRMDENYTCYPSVATIAVRGLSERTVQRSLLALQKLRLIKREARYKKKGEQTSNLITLVRPPWAVLMPPEEGEPTSTGGVLTDGTGVPHRQPGDATASPRGRHTVAPGASHRRPGDARMAPEGTHGSNPAKKSTSHQEEGASDPSALWQCVIAEVGPYLSKPAENALRECTLEKVGESAYRILAPADTDTRKKILLNMLGISHALRRAVKQKVTVTLA